MRERLKTTRSRSLAGFLLLAHPSLREETFRRTVILMSTHNKDGAMGVVLNRPLGRRLGELNGEFQLGPLAGVPVFRGGPVETSQLILAGWQLQEGGFKLSFGLEPEKASQLAGEEGVHLRAFLGYSGWTGGQLEKELKGNTWVVAPVPPDLMTHPQDGGLWRSVLSGLGFEWRLLADEPDDTSVN